MLSRNHRWSPVRTILLQEVAESMCGVAGMIDERKSAAEIEAALLRMTDAIVHRGPDDAGAVVTAGCGIGMRRLSIIDIEGGQQPIANESRDVHVVCNGEIYNHQELRRSLQQQGHRFRTQSDVEVVVHLYEQYGDACFKHLKGMFGLAIWDRGRDRLLIARDRLGKKPMFFAQRDNAFWFGSEIKCLLAAEPRLNEPDYRTLGQFLQFGFISQPDSIFKAIRRLPAGHYAVLESGNFKIQPYWQLSFEADESLSENAWCEQLETAFVDAVRARLMSEVPLGVFLSGGLDSSAVVAFAHAAGLDPLKTFTIGFDRKEWDESQDASQVAKHFGTEHHLLRLSESDMSRSFSETLAAIVRHCDEPFGDASAIPTYHVAQLAKQHVTVILSGDGGDELFAGYDSYRGAMFAEKYRRRIPHVIGSRVLPGIARGAARLAPSPWRYQAQRVAKVLADSSRPLIEAYRDKISIWNAKELRDLLPAETYRNADYVGDQYLPPALWQTMQGRRDLVSRLTEVDVRSYLLDDILVKVDRMSMAHALEVRSPFLDHEIVELAARMPTRMKVRGRQGKYILREVMRRKLPGKTIRKSKQGFRVPLRDWFRGELRSYVHDTLGGNDLPSQLFCNAAIRKTLDEHDRGTADHANRLWLLLVFAAWHQEYQVDNRTSTGSVLGQSGTSARPSTELFPAGGSF